MIKTRKGPAKKIDNLKVGDKVILKRTKYSRARYLNSVGEIIGRSTIKGRFRVDFEHLQNKIWASLYKYKEDCLKLVEINPLFGGKNEFRT